MLLDVIEEPAKTFLPQLTARVPHPAGQFPKALCTVGPKAAMVVVEALRVDPATEPVAVDDVRVSGAGVTVKFDKPFQQPEPELPRRGGLVDQAHLECADEIDAERAGKS